MRINLGFLKMETWNDKKLFSINNHLRSKGFWIKFFGYGIHFSNDPLCFSERNGFKKYISISGKWKIKFVKPKQWRKDVK